MIAHATPALDWLNSYVKKFINLHSTLSWYTCRNSDLLLSSRLSLFLLQHQETMIKVDHLDKRQDKDINSRIVF